MSRVFHDRLNCEEDRKWFFKAVGQISQNILSVSYEELKIEELMYSDIFSLNDEVRVYEKIEDKKKLIKLL